MKIKSFFKEGDAKGNGAPLDRCDSQSYRVKERSPEAVLLYTHPDGCGVKRFYERVGKVNVLLKVGY